MWRSFSRSFGFCFLCDGDCRCSITGARRISAKSKKQVDKVLLTGVPEDDATTTLKELKPADRPIEAWPPAGSAKAASGAETEENVDSSDEESSSEDADTTISLGGCTQSSPIKLMATLSTLSMSALVYVLLESLSSRASTDVKEIWRRAGKARNVRRPRENILPEFGERERKSARVWREIERESAQKCKTVGSKKKVWMPASITSAEGSKSAVASLTDSNAYNRWSPPVCWASCASSRSSSVRAAMNRSPLSCSAAVSSAVAFSGRG
jgi:hypothetical protein